MTVYTTDDSIFWKKMWGNIKQSRLIIFIVIIAIFSGTYFKLLLTTEEFESTASILVKLGRENIALPGAVNKGQLLSSGVRKEDINSEVAILTSPNLLTKVIDSIGYEKYLPKQKEPVTLLQKIKFQFNKLSQIVKSKVKNTAIFLKIVTDIPMRDKVIIEIGKRLKVERQKESDVIGISLILPDPALAQLTINTLIEYYMVKRVDIRRDSDLRSFFKKQVTQQQNKNRVLEQKKFDIQEEYSLSDITEQKELLLKQKNSLQKDNDSLLNERILLLSGRKTLPRVSNKSRRASGINNSVSDIKTQLTKLRTKYFQLTQQYKNNSKILSDLNKEILNLEHLVLAKININLDLNQKKIISINKRLTKLNHGEELLIMIDHDIDLVKKNYSKFSEKFQDAEINNLLDLKRISNIAILDEPTLPIKPKKPNKVLTLSLSIPLGLFFGIALVLIREYLNQSVRSEEDITALDINFLGYFRPDTHKN